MTHYAILCHDMRLLNSLYTGAACLQRITQALQKCSSFSLKCSAIGPVEALCNSMSLAQQVTNCSIDLHNALSAVDAAALQASPELQEDLQQFVRQLSRLNICSYQEQQHKTVLELHVQVSPP